MEIQIVRERITREELREMARAWYGEMAKAVVDIAQGIMALPAEMHVDEEQLLLEHGSRQEDLWGINLHPDENDEHFIEFDSMINIRPSQHNRSTGVENPETRRRIGQIVATLVE